MISQFADGTPGIPATFNAPLESFAQELDPSFLPFPTRMVELADGEDFTQGRDDPPSIIKAGVGSLVTFAGTDPTFTIGNCCTVYGDDFEVQANGVTTAFLKNATLVPFFGGWRSLATSSREIDQDLADALIEGVVSASQQSVLDAARDWIIEERRRWFNVLWTGQREAYAGVLDFYGNNGDANISATQAPTSSFSTETSPVVVLEPDTIGVQRVHFEQGAAATSLTFDLTRFGDALTSATGNFRSVQVAISAGRINSRAIDFINMPSGLSWAQHASPINVMGNQAGLVLHNVPFFTVDQIDDELFFCPHVISPV